MADGLGVCAIELERDGPSYTVDTLNAIHTSEPEAELTFILGADIAGTLSSWHEPARLLELATLAIAGRSGGEPATLTESLAEIGVRAPRVESLDSPRIDISSSLVRQRVAEGAPLEPLVGTEVARYIGEHGLYGARARAVSG